MCMACADCIERGTCSRNLTGQPPLQQHHTLQHSIANCWPCTFEPRVTPTHQLHNHMQVQFFQQESTRINPSVPIPPAATAVHRITQDMLKGCPRFAALSKGLFAFMDGCDLAGYNIRRLTVPMLT